MEHGAHLLKEGTVQSLCDAIFLWCVMYGKSSLDPSGSEVCIEFVAQVFPTTVGVQLFDSGAMLGPQPGLEQEVCLVSFAFECKEVNMCVVCFVISEADIYSFPLSDLTGDGPTHLCGSPPQVSRRTCHFSLWVQAYTLYCIVTIVGGYGWKFETQLGTN